jgi:hypothetical protein
MKKMNISSSSGIHSERKREIGTHSYDIREDKKGKKVKNIVTVQERLSRLLQ